MTGYLIAAIAVSVAVTFFLRALPFLFFRDGHPMPEWLQKLGQMLPSAIMAVLIIYCLKGAKSDFRGTGIPGLIAAAVTVLCYKWKHNTFLGIVAGTAVYMVLIRIM